MSGVYAVWGLHLPTEWLVALARSDLRRWVYHLQPIYGLIRFLHLAGMAGFFGAVGLVDLRVCGVFAAVAEAPFLAGALRVVRWTLLVVLTSGVVLFLFDPIQTGSHTLFAPKLVLVALGIVNAVAFHRRAFAGPAARRTLAVLSLVIWTAVIACATVNHVERPLKPLRALQGIDRYTD